MVSLWDTLYSWFSEYTSLPGILQYGFWKPNLVFKTHIRFLTKYGFYSKPVCVFWKLNLIFKTQMWFLITHFKFGIFFANSVNFEIIVKTRFGFQNTNLDLKNRIWFYMKTKCGFLIWKTVFGFMMKTKCGFFEIRILKPKFGFKNTNSDFKNQMWVLFVTIGVCQKIFMLTTW